MSKDFWGPVFAKLHENLELLKQICHDTSDHDLISWLKPNPFLWSSCARFIRKKKITNKNGLIEKIIDFAKKDSNLRKLIFFNWVEKNSKTMSFTGLPSDDSAFERLLAGEFGNKEKIEILSIIDPRQGMDKFYQKYFEIKQQSEQLQKDTSLKESEEDTVELQKYIDLQKQNDQLSIEIKSLRQKFKENSKDTTALQNKLRERDQKVQSLEIFIAELENKIDSLNRELRTSENKDPEITQIKVSEKLELTNRINDLSQLLSEREEQFKELTEQNNTKNRLIQRLEEQIETLSSQKINSDDQERKISNLRNLLQQAQDEEISHRAYGQIINFETTANSVQWLLDAFGGELIELPEKLLLNNQIALNEFCCVCLNDKGQITNIFSLEDNKKIVSGYFSYEDNNLVLVTPDRSYKVRCMVEENLLNLPVKATFLEGQGDREPGIYGYSLLKSQETNKEAPSYTANVATILNFLRLKNYSRERLIKELQKISIKAEQIGSNKIKFDKDYRQVLNSARMSLPLKGVCSNRQCIEKLDKELLARDLRTNEECFVCGKKEKAKTNLPEYDFKGRKIIIVGGDYVGTDYVETLQNFNLNVTWVSGFESSGNFLSGLENYDLIVIIIKQISHTLLREITKKSKNVSTPLFYSKKRGTSGLLNELNHYYKPD